jgi:hypothetical protein
VISKGPQYFVAAQALLLEQYKDSAKFTACIEQILNHGDEIEDLFHEISLANDFTDLTDQDAPAGARLDRIGALAIVPRMVGEGDAGYLDRIRVAVKQKDAGTPEGIIRALQEMGKEVTAYEPNYPAGYLVLAPEEIPQSTLDSLSPAGVNGIQGCPFYFVSGHKFFLQDESTHLCGQGSCNFTPAPEPPTYELLYLDEAEISMLTADGSSGASAYQLTPVFDDAAAVPSDCTWSTSNPAAITVSGSGLCTCVGAGTATITASLNGVNKSCSVTGFATLPDDSARYLLKGGRGPAILSGEGVFVQFDCSAHSPTTKARVQLKKANHSQAFYTLVTVEPGKPGIALLLLVDGGQNEPRISTYSADQIITTWETTSLFSPVTRLDMGYIPDSIYYDGGSIPTTADTGTPASYPLISYLSWHNAVEKIVSCGCGVVGDIESVLSLASDRYYIPQDYIRYTNITGRTNYAKIPNRGTLGTAYDFTQFDVPEGWFNV